MSMRPAALSRLLLGLLLFWAGPARAEWFQASSSHFVIYANQSEASLRAFSTQLEQYHAAMEWVTGVELEAPSPSNRVMVFVVGNGAQVRRHYADISGGRNAAIGGFYLPRAGASVAIVPRVKRGGRDLDFSMITLLHEYAHHFMMTGSAVSMPRWYSEGGAEFFSSASFHPDGSVHLGEPAQHRAAELALARDVGVEELLDPAVYESRKGKGYDAFYGKSWLLFHYLTWDQARKGQLNAYLRLLAKGKGFRDAAIEAFGDFTRLDKDLDAYLNRSHILMVSLPPALVQPGPVQLRRLSEGEAAMMPVLIQSKRGVSPEQAQSVVEQARSIAAGFPSDPAVLSALAEAEYDAGNDAAAIAAADRALAIDPRQANAYVQKGYAQFRMARQADDRAKAYARAREPFVRLNQLENDHPLPLIYYYRSFMEQGLPPPDIAVKGLERAVELAPFDRGLRMTVAMHQLREGRRDLARGNLGLLAHDPHGGQLAEFAGRIIARLDAEPDWNGSGVEPPADQDAGDEGGQTQGWQDRMPGIPSR